MCAYCSADGPQGHQTGNPARGRTHARTCTNIAENIEGGERYPINVRYQRDCRDNVDKMRGVLIGTPSGAQIPLGQVAKISFTHGLAMIRDEDGALTGYIYIRSQELRLRRLRRTGKQTHSRETRLARKLHFPMVGRI